MILSQLECVQQISISMIMCRRWSKMDRVMLQDRWRLVIFLLSGYITLK